MNKRPTLIAMLFLLFFFMQPTLVHSQPDASQSGQTAKMDWQKELGLTTEQTDKIKQIKDASYDDMKEYRVQKWGLYKKMVMMSHNKEIDEQKLKSLISDMNTISEKMMRQEIKMKHDIYMVLTPDQKTKMDQMMQARLKEMEKVYGQ
ncbi:Spy/CpxP family protein refolding chaperone [Legionella sp. W05-934-2]|jgi:Spy/CpxP family protein refolding chaperone|uniref:Spy/CpxP family protein refolding chaperone n=1 Tax=Legionella sp. W05-934-2 TaxID=1198649 RepID=UPI003462FB0E